MRNIDIYRRRYKKHCFRIIAVDPQFVSGNELLEELWFSATSVNQVISDYSTICAALIASSLKAFWTTRIVSTEQCSSFTQNLMQIRCSTHSVILNVTATQYTCSLNGIYHSHWLVQWSCHCSHLCIPVHSPWLPSDIDVMQTVRVMLIMAGFFQDQYIT